MTDHERKRYQQEITNLQARIAELEAAILKHATQFVDEPLQEEYDLWAVGGVHVYGGDFR